jgi:uncharacterized membrane protein YqhA
MKSFLESSRYIVLLGIIGTFLAALALFLFGLAGVLAAIRDGVSSAGPFDYDHLKELSIVLIQTIDIFLLATVLYIIALGLYELFINEALDLPHWLEVRTLDDLKARLLGVIVVILPVTFLGKLVEWKSGQDILWIGLAVGIVVLSIAAIQYVAVMRHKK